MHRNKKTVTEKGQRTFFEVRKQNPKLQQGTKQRVKRNGKEDICADFFFLKHSILRIPFSFSLAFSWGKKTKRFVVIVECNADRPHGNAKKKDEQKKKEGKGEI